MCRLVGGGASCGGRQIAFNRNPGCLVRGLCASWHEPASFGPVDLLPKWALVAIAGVVELVDTPDLGSGGASRGGSSPSARTISHRSLSRPSLAGRV
jgi:hypothetical protein